MGNKDFRRGPSYVSTYTKYQRRLQLAKAMQEDQHGNAVAEVSSAARHHKYNAAKGPRPSARKPASGARKALPGSLPSSIPSHNMPAHRLVRRGQGPWPRVTRTKRNLHYRALHKPTQAVSGKRFDFLRLFDLEDPVRDAMLKTIRHKVYAWIWSRDRCDRARCDFIVSEFGVKRNVRGAPTGRTQSVRRFDTGLLYAGRVVGQDFRSFIYGVNNLEIEVNLKSSAEPSAIAELNNVVANLTRCSSFRLCSRQVTVKLHMPSAGSYPCEALPNINARALSTVAETLETFELNKKPNHSLRVTVVFSAKRPSNYELVYVALPFYPLSFTGWCLWGLYEGVHRKLHQDLVLLCDGAFSERTNSGIGREQIPAAT